MAAPAASASSAAAVLKSKAYLLGHGPLLPKKLTGASAAAASGGMLKRRPEQAVLDLINRLLRSPNPALTLNARNRDGDTVLHACAKAGYSDAVELLLREGSPHVDLDASTAGGFNALAFASRGGFLDIVVKLVAAGAEIDVFAQKNAERRFFPVTEDRKSQVLNAIRVGRAAYALQLQSTLLHGQAAPFDRLPEVLVDMVVEYILAEPAALSGKGGDQTRLSQRKQEALEAEEAVLEAEEATAAVAAVKRHVAGLDE